MFSTRQRTGYLFLALILGHVILISAQVTTSSGTRVLEAVTFGLFSEIQRTATTIVGGVGQAGKDRTVDAARTLSVRMGDADC